MQTPPPPGRVVVLNGTSSSGKSSLAAALSGLLPWQHLVMRVDDFYGMCRWPDADTTPLETRLARVQSGFARAVAATARAGNLVITDLVLSSPWRLPDLLDALDGLGVTLVGVHCSPAELARREHARGDREPGQAARQLPFVHTGVPYDIEIDTTSTSPEDCARTVVDRLREEGANGTLPQRS